MKSAFAYLRVSSLGQIDGHGFDRQLESIEAFGRKSGYKIEGVYREVISGTVEDRPVLNQLITDIRANGVDTVIIEEMTRLGRDAAVTMRLQIVFVTHGINLIGADTGQNITEAVQSDPMAKAIIQMQSVFAELDKSLLVKKLRKAREQKRAEKGKCEGRKGYRDSKKGLELLATIRKLRRKPRGDGKRRLTYVQVAEKMNEMGHRTITDKEFSTDIIRSLLHRAKPQRTKAA